MNKAEPRDLGGIQKILMPQRDIPEGMTGDKILPRGEERL